MEDEVGVGQCVAATVGVFAAGAAEEHHYGSASLGSSSCVAVA